jgi:hypothetical protein
LLSRDGNTNHFKDTDPQNRGHHVLIAGLRYPVLTPSLRADVATYDKPRTRLASVKPHGPYRRCQQTGLSCVGHGLLFLWLAGETAIYLCQFLVQNPLKDADWKEEESQSRTQQPRLRRSTREEAVRFLRPYTRALATLKSWGREGSYREAPLRSVTLEVDSAWALGSKKETTDVIVSLSHIENASALNAPACRRLPHAF